MNTNTRCFLIQWEWYAPSNGRLSLIHTVDRKVTILAAFKMISDQTCILFHEYTNEMNYIDIISGTGWVQSGHINTFSPSQQFTVNSQPLLPFSCVQSFIFLSSCLIPSFSSSFSHLSLSSLNSSCASYVGFQGGAQSLYFGRVCNVGNLCHELMHALGLHHEHTRPDRDQYVTIQWDNVVPGYSHQHNILNHLTGITCGSGAGLVNLSPEEL